MNDGINNMVFARTYKYRINTKREKARPLMKADPEKLRTGKTHPLRDAVIA